MPAILDSFRATLVPQMPWVLQHPLKGEGAAKRRVRGKEIKSLPGPSGHPLPSGEGLARKQISNSTNGLNTAAHLLFAPSETFYFGQVWRNPLVPRRLLPSGDCVRKFHAKGGKVA